MATHRKLALLVVGCLALGAVAGAQFKQILKIGGAAAIVNNFGKDIDKGFNQLTGFKPTANTVTKVVPIISGGLGSRKSVGAAQVMGPKAQVAKVSAVAQLEQGLFGEIEITALIPMESKEIVKNVKRVDGVGVSGIVDLRL